MLAAKTSLAVRVDALGEDTDTTIGIEAKAKVMINNWRVWLICLQVEARLRECEQNKLRRISGTGKSGVKLEKYESLR